MDNKFIFNYGIHRVFLNGINPLEDFNLAVPMWEMDNLNLFPIIILFLPDYSWASEKVSTSGVIWLLAPESKSHVFWEFVSLASITARALIFFTSLSCISRFIINLINYLVVIRTRVIWATPPVRLVFSFELCYL